MSNTFAIDLPDFAPREVEQHPRHIEIVSSREQRRARPRMVYALVAVAGLFVILMAQLLLSIWLSGGAYQITSLQTAQKNVSRDQQSLIETMNVLQSPQNLATRAAALGMIGNTGDQGYLDYSTGTVVRAATAADVDPDTAPTDAATYTPNSLITPGMAALGAAAAAAITGTPAATTSTAGTVASGAAATGTTAGAAATGSTAGATSAAGTPGTATVSGAPAATTAPGSVPSTPAALPGPITH